MLFYIPTDTCYGLAGFCSPADYNAIYQAKWRPKTKRLAVLVRDFDMLQKYADISQEGIEFLWSYPYPFSVILPRKDTDLLPSVLQTEEYTYISFRIASLCVRSNLEELEQKMRQEWGDFPIFLTSANISWNREAHTLKEAQKQCGLFWGQDGGVCQAPASNIFRLLSSNEVVYIRKNY